LKNYSVGLIQAKSSGCTLLHKTHFTLYVTSKKKLWLLGFQTVFFKKTAVFSAGSGMAGKLAEIFSNITQKVQVELRILCIENIFLNFIPGRKNPLSMTTSGFLIHAAGRAESHSSPQQDIAFSVFGRIEAFLGCNAPKQFGRINSNSGEFPMILRITKCGWPDRRIT